MEKVTKKTPPVVAMPVADTFTPEPILNPIMKKFPDKKQSATVAVIAMIVVALLGLGTGWAFAKHSNNSQSASSETSVKTSNSVSTETEAGINDEAAFPDTAQGILKEGGIEGEGTHQLDRGMGASKNVYLSSTVINLQNFVGKKVEVRGQTISGKKAGWLMDVGKIKIIQ